MTLTSHLSDDPEKGIVDDGSVFQRIVNGVLYTADNPDEILDMIEEALSE